MRFAQALALEGIRIPRIYPELCHEQVLVQSFERGCLLPEILDWPLKDRMLIGRSLMLILFRSLFVLGEVHGDPHPGNTFYRYNEKNRPEVVLLDFGCTVKIAKSRRLALLKLILACRQGITQSMALRCFISMGFDPEKLMHIKDRIAEISHILVLPFRTDNMFSLEEWQLSANFSTLLGEHRWWFRAAGPADLFLILRAFQGLTRQLEQLKVKLPWWPLLEKALDANTLSEADKISLADLPVAIDDLPKSLAHSLCVEIKHHEKIQTSLKMPASAALELEKIMPEELLTVILSDKKIDFITLQNDLRCSQLMPQSIFSWYKEDKTYHVWLE